MHEEACTLALFMSLSNAILSSSRNALIIDKIITSKTNAIVREQQLQWRINNVKRT